MKAFDGMNITRVPVDKPWYLLSTEYYTAEERSVKCKRDTKARGNAREGQYNVTHRCVGHTQAKLNIVYISINKTLFPCKESYDKPRQRIKKQRHHFANKGPSSQSYGFSSSHVQV
ncbi:unnamed protein product [Rangifer tarandus platyrhynchus]